MAVSFDEARKIVEDEIRPEWTPDYGTLVTLNTGWEDDSFWRVTAGAKEYLVDGNTDYVILDAWIYLVSKRTGKITKLHVIDNLKRLDGMTRV